MNFKKKFQRGLQGLNFGLPTGLPEIDKMTGGIQKEAIYAIGAAPKVGKTTFVDFCFLISPFLYYLEHSKDKNLDIEWIYFSFEISRVRKEFKLACFFMYYDYNITTFRHKDEVHHISPMYLEGKMRDNDNELIPVSEEHQKVVMEIYEKRLIPLFGEYDENNNKIKDGLVQFVDVRDNPTGVRNYIGEYSAKNGKWVKQPYQVTERLPSGQMKQVTREKRVGWVPNNPDKFTIIITDHMRKLKDEKGFTKKQIVDKMSEYQVEFRDWCGFTFVDIIHLNRNMSDVQRMKFNAEYLYPTGDDIKETGNLSEDANYIFTLMNPNDEKFNINKHFGLEIKTPNSEEIYPNYRSVHLVESRETECPVHFRSEMLGNINLFRPLVEQSGQSYGFS